MNKNLNLVNDYINTQALKKELAETTRVSINEFLNIDFANKLYLSLKNDVDWDYAYYAKGAGQKLTSDEIKTLPTLELERRLVEVRNCTPDEYQFSYHAYMIVTAYLAGRNQGHLLHFFLEYINTPKFLQLMRDVTGCQTIVKIDAQATYYSKGDFLKEHNDADSDKGRRFAYVLSLTKNWKPDWGGLLHFTKEDKVLETMVPSFNRLAIFEVPQTHYVSQVSSYSGENRFSITGWMYDR